MSEYRECKDCPHIIGDITERDCYFPDCSGGWEAIYKQNGRRRVSDPTISDLIQYAGVIGTFKNGASTVIEHKDIPKLEAEIRQQIGKEILGELCPDSDWKVSREWLANRIRKICQLDD